MGSVWEDGWQREGIPVLSIGGRSRLVVEGRGPSDPCLSFRIWKPIIIVWTCFIHFFKSFRFVRLSLSFGRRPYYKRGGEEKKNEKICLQASTEQRTIKQTVQTLRPL